LSLLRITVETRGAFGSAGSTGSNSWNSRLPPDWRTIVANALYEFGAALTQVPMQPSA
jgi:hypothetical protein